MNGAPEPVDRVAEGAAGALAASLRHPDIAHLAQVLRRRPAVADPPADGTRWAAVALVLRVGDAGAVERLMSRGAEYEGDPGSGHVALPGGGGEPQDADLA